MTAAFHHLAALLSNSFLLALMITLGFASEGRAQVDADEHAVDQAMTSLLNETQFDGLASQPESWRANLTPKQRGMLVAAIVPRLWSVRPLPWSFPPG